MAVMITIEQVRKAVENGGFDSRLAGWNQRNFDRAGGFENFARKALQTVADVNLLAFIVDDRITASVVAGRNADEAVTIID